MTKIKMPQGTRFLFALAAAMCLSILAADATAAFTGSRAIPYEGTLFDGADLADGRYDFRVSFYVSADEKSAPIWEEVHSAAQVSRGRFLLTITNGMTILGDVNALWNPGNSGLYLGISVCKHIEGDAAPCEYVALDGRQRVLTVPFANRIVQDTPVGTIISVAPFVDAPDPRFWLPCDGSAVPEDSALGAVIARKSAELKTPLPFETPIMNEYVFPSGGNHGVPEVGGSNDGHHHSFALNTDSAGEHDHSFWIIALHGDASKGSSYRTLRQDMHRQPHRTGASGKHEHKVVGTIGRVDGSNGDAAGSNRPLFYKVVYYIRYN